MSYFIKCASVAALLEELGKPRGCLDDYAIEVSTADGVQRFHESCFMLQAERFGQNDNAEHTNIYTILSKESDCPHLCSTCAEPVNHVDDTSVAEAWNDIPT